MHFVLSSFQILLPEKCLHSSVNIDWFGIFFPCFSIVCLLDIDECESQMCLNGGTCTDLINGRTCACVPGFTGKSCEISKCSIFI